MKVPIYRFWAGKALGFTITGGTTINTSGQTVTASNTVSSNKLPVSSDTIFVNYSPVRDTWEGADNILMENLNIHMYGAGYSYLGKIGIGEARMCKLNAGTKYIAVGFIGVSADMQEAHKIFVKTGFSEIYEVGYINPHYKDLAKKYSKESGQEFFRTSLEGQITLFGDDYDLVHDASINDILGFFVEKFDAQEGKWEIYYEGKFSKTDCKLDYDRKKCELKLTAMDAYNRIMDNYDNVYDLIKLAPAISKINMYKRPVVQVYVRGSSTISNFFGGTYWENDVNEAIDSHDDLTGKYHFAYIKAGNEFMISGAGIPGVNGVYAGTNGTWKQQNGYTCYVGQAVQNTSVANLYIKRDSDNTTLYVSTDLIYFPDLNNRYIDDDITMVNINDPYDVFTISNAFAYHIYSRLLCDVDAVTDSEGTQSTYDVPEDDFVMDNKNYKKCIGLSGGLFFCSSKTVKEPTKYGVNNIGEYFTNQFIAPSTGIGRPLPIGRSLWVNASLWYVYSENYDIFEKKLRKKYALKNGYSIAAVIKALLNKIDPSIVHKDTAEYSRFLYNTTNPLLPERFFVYIAQKTNILKGEYDQAAQKAEISFKSVMDMLRDCFRCYWYIDGNKLKIEHVKFFINGGSYLSQAALQLDFTKLSDQFNRKPTSYFQSEISYDKSKLSSRYEFNWMDDVTDLFGGVYMDVKANYIQDEQKEDVSLNSFSSDVDLMLLNPSNFSDDGFALLCPVKTEDGSLELPIIGTQLLSEDGNLYKAVVQNWYASWIYLIRFYMYDMPAENVDCNMTSVQVQNIKACMRHDMMFPSEKDLNALMLIKTGIGNGKIDGMSINIDNRNVTVTLAYIPE